MTRFYAARRGLDVSVSDLTETDSYDAAMRVHSDALGRESHATLNADGTPRVAEWQPIILLDVGSAEAVGDDLRRLILTTPLLAAIYRAGFGAGREHGLAL